ncbi:unnamed protein product [Closterium sp. NIES-64]|nr:unnamed protein product [Closterium sp. NIES-64]
MILLAVLRLYVLYTTPRAQQRAVAPGWRGERGIVAAAALALMCAVVPLMQLSARVSLSSFSTDADLPPYEVCSLILAFLTWALTTTALFWERRRMAVKGAWLLRFAVLYVMVGQLAKLRFVLILQQDFQALFVELSFGFTSAHVLLGLLALLFFPNLLPLEHPSPGLSSSPALAGTEAEAAAPLLPPAAAGPVGGAEGEAAEEEGDNQGQVCPEDYTSFINRTISSHLFLKPHSCLTFGWMTPLMALGYRRPLEDSDVWRLNDGDHTATVYGRFERVWREEKGRPKPWLLRALHSCFGRRVYLKGIGNDASQFVGPLMLSRLLSAMQSDEPAWHGYIYATIIFLGLGSATQWEEPAWHGYIYATIIFLGLLGECAQHGSIYSTIINTTIIVLGLVGGVICEAQYFQNVMRVGFQLRQAMVGMGGGVSHGHRWLVGSELYCALGRVALGGGCYCGVHCGGGVLDVLRILKTSLSIPMVSPSQPPLPQEVVSNLVHPLIYSSYPAILSCRPMRRWQRCSASPCGLVAAVFSKSLRLSHSGRQGFSTGRITNMMTNDAESLQMVCQQLHGLWSAPLRILVCIFLLYQQLGVASVLGLLMLLLMILAQAVIVNRVQKLVKASLQRSDKRVALMSELLPAMDVVNSYTSHLSPPHLSPSLSALPILSPLPVQKLVKASLQRSDKRVALMSEVLAAMDVVKLYTWEGSFQSKVARVRADEMGQISKAQYIMAINFLLMSVLPVLVTVVSFGCYSLLGHQLTAAKAFTSISLFAVLHYPLHMFPSLITQEVNVNVSPTLPFCYTPPRQVVNVNVSLTRLQEMLLADETNIDAPAPPIDPAKPAVEVSHASFAWSAAPSAPAPTAAAANGAATGPGGSSAAGGGGGVGREKVGVGGEGKEKDVGGTLTDVTLSVEPGKLVAVVGATGQGKSSLVSALLGEMPTRCQPRPWKGEASRQGKSSLVSALLGEMPMVSGDSPPIIRGRVAYVSWIFNATVRENILFGLPYDRQRYERAVRVSALERDLQLLPGGDLTEIGERGVNVNGGQKQRISIARAVYSDADVFLFDDPLSALDTHVAKQKQHISSYSNADVFFSDDPLSALDAQVAKQVYDTCVRTELAGRTRIMVTNQLHFLPAVDWVVMVEGRRIAEQGPYVQLKASAPKFQRLLEKAGVLEEHGDAEVGGEGGETAGGSETSAEAAAAAAMSGSSSNSGGGCGGSAAAENGFSSSRNQVGEKSGAGKGERRGAGKGEKSGAAGGTTLVQVEEKVQGVVSAAVVWRYVRAMGGAGVLAVLISLYVLVEAARVLASVWISVWTGSVSQEESGGHGSLYFVAVYSLISLGQVLLTFANQYFLVFSSQRAAGRLHDAMLAAILRAPMSFFHTNPVGRLINRFTKDTADIDKNLAQYTSLCLGGIFQLLSTFALIGVLNTVALWAIVPLLLLFYIVYLYFQNTAREVKRWDSVTRSPVYSQVRFEAAQNFKPNEWTIVPLLLLFYVVYLHFQNTAMEMEYWDSVTRSPVYSQVCVHFVRRGTERAGNYEGVQGSSMGHGRDERVPPTPPSSPPSHFSHAHNPSPSQFTEALNGLATMRAYRAVAWRMEGMNERHQPPLLLPPSTCIQNPSTSQFAEALNGLATIRAYRAAQLMAAMNGHAVDRNTRFTLVSMSANRWLAFRLEFLGGLMIFGSRCSSLRAANFSSVPPHSPAACACPTQHPVYPFSSSSGFARSFSCPASPSPPLQVPFALLAFPCTPLFLQGMTSSPATPASRLLITPSHLLPPLLPLKGLSFTTSPSFACSSALMILSSTSFVTSRVLPWGHLSPAALFLTPSPVYLSLLPPPCLSDRILHQPRSRAWVLVYSVPVCSRICTRDLLPPTHTAVNTCFPLLRPLPFTRAPRAPPLVGVLTSFSPLLW